MRAIARRLRMVPYVTALFVLFAVAASAETLPLDPSVAPSPPDYDADAAWLCRPGRPDICAQPTTATVFAAGRSPQTVTYKPNPTAQIDCFYLYPTVSRAPGDNAPVAATVDETDVAKAQLARFSAVCRPFAPLYRQVTLRKMLGTPGPAPFELAYADALAAWHSYLAKDNAGRGFVLIGHSQGAAILAWLMAAEIDGKPLAARLVGAIVPGARIEVPEGGVVGGTFRGLPLCKRATQTGCVIAYSAYMAGGKMPADAYFGRARTPDMVNACVEPTALAGKATLDADLPTMLKLREKYPTDFIELPGFLSAACIREGPFSILSIATKPEGSTGDARMVLDRLATFHSPWGVHVLDIGFAEGTLVDIVRRQAAAYARK